MSTALQSLRITKAPKAFAALAAKHNALVSMIEGTRGASGVKVLMADRGMMISGDQTGMLGTGLGGTGGTGGPVQAVGSDGLLVSVAQSASAGTPNTYPNTLRAGNGSTYAIMDSTGFRVVNGGNSLSIPFANIARNMGIRALGVCDNGNSKTIDDVASDPY